jgi:hypothetical protein
MGSASSVSPIDRGASTASAQPLLPAGARHERTLEGVSRSDLFSSRCLRLLHSPSTTQKAGASEAVPRALSPAVAGTPPCAPPLVPVVDDLPSLNLCSHASIGMTTVGSVGCATRTRSLALRRRENVDHAHNGDRAAVVHVRFRHPLLAGPHVPGLRDELLVRPLRAAPRLPGNGTPCRSPWLGSRTSLPAGRPCLASTPSHSQGFPRRAS